MKFTNTLQHYREKLKEWSHLVKNLVQSTTLAVATLLGSHAGANSPELVQITREAPAQIETSSVSETCDEITAEQPTIPLATTTIEPNISWLQDSPVSKKIRINSDGKADISRMYGNIIDDEELSEHNTKFRIRGDFLEVLFTKEDGSILIVASIHLSENTKIAIQSQIHQENTLPSISLSHKIKESSPCVIPFTKFHDNLPPPNHPILTSENKEKSPKSTAVPEVGFTILLSTLIARFRKEKRQSEKTTKKRKWFHIRSHEVILSDIQKEQFYLVIRLFLQKIESKTLIRTQNSAYTYIIYTLEQLFHEIEQQDEIPTKSILLRLDGALKYFHNNSLPENEFSQTYKDIEWYFWEFAKNLRAKNGKIPNIKNFTSVQYQKRFRNITRGTISRT